MECLSRFSHSQNAISQKSLADEKDLGEATKILEPILLQVLEQVSVIAGAGHFRQECWIQYDPSHFASARDRIVWNTKITMDAIM